jgi:hypothetical protein
MGNWVQGSQIAAMFTCTPVRIDPFAGSFIVRRITRKPVKMKPRKRDTRKNHRWYRFIEALKNDINMAAGRLFCLFVFIAAGTDLLISLLDDISPTASLTRIITMTAAVIGFLLPKMAAYAPGSRLLDAYRRLTDNPRSDAATRDHLETDAQQV